jgi:hypothetical protein
MSELNPKPGNPWWLIFERGHMQESPGAVSTSGLFGGSQQTPPRWRTFKPLLITQAPGWKQALENAVKETGRLGEYAAVECNVFTSDLLSVTGGTEGTV